MKELTEAVADVLTRSLDQPNGFIFISINADQPPDDESEVTFTVISNLEPEARNALLKSASDPTAPLPINRERRKQLDREMDDFLDSDGPRPNPRTDDEITYCVLYRIRDDWKEMVTDAIEKAERLGLPADEVGEFIAVFRDAQKMKPPLLTDNRIDGPLRGMFSGDLLTVMRNAMRISRDDSLSPYTVGALTAIFSQLQPGP